MHTSSRSPQLTLLLLLGILCAPLSNRIGARFMTGDNFDGAQGPSGASDFLSLIQIGYRFDLLD